jgi:hypothetical protein
VCHESVALPFSGAAPYNARVRNMQAGQARTGLKSDR